MRTIGGTRVIDTTLDDEFGPPRSLTSVNDHVVYDTVCITRVPEFISSGQCPDEFDEVTHDDELRETEDELSDPEARDYGYRDLKRQTVHPETVDEDDDDDDLPPEDNSKDTDYRNNLVRAALAAPPPAKPASEVFDKVFELFKKDNTSFVDDPDCDQMLSLLENIVILGYQMHKSTCFMDMFVAIVGYIKMNTSSSIIQTVLKLVDSVSKFPDEEPIVPNAIEVPTTTSLMQKWDLFQGNPMFKKISYLMSAAMSLTVCNVKKIEWSPFGLELVACEAAKGQLKAYDVIDALLSTFTWMADVGYRVFQEKSLMPLLYADSAMQKFNTECDYVIAHAEQVLAGNGGCVEDFSKKVQDSLRTVCELKSVKDTGPTAIWLQQKYSILVDISYKIVAKYRNTALREAPFGIVFTGESGVGKSTISKIAMKTALCAMGYDVDPRRIITKDMFDKFDSTYTSEILGVYLDDVGNGKAEFAQVSPSDVIIKFFNNMAAQAVKAELNAKGIVFINFKVGILTSNFPDLQVRCYSNKPESILRRFVHVRTAIKPKYRIPGGVSLDTTHPDLVGASLCHDIWSLTVEECFIYETALGKSAYRFQVQKVKLPNGETKVCKDLDLSDFLDVLVVLAKRHHAHQTGIVKRSEEFDTMPMCPTCSKPVPLCKCIKPDALADNIGNVIVDSAISSVKSYINKWFAPVNLINSCLGYWPVRQMTTRQLSHEMTHILNETATPWLVALTPQSLFQTSLFQRSVKMWQKSAALYNLRTPAKIGVAIGTTATCLSLFTNRRHTAGITGFTTWIFSMSMWSQYKSRLALYESEYTARRDALSDCAKEVRDGYMVKGVFSIATLVVIVKAYQLWYRSNLETSPHAITKESIEKTPSWFGFAFKKLGINVEVSEASKRSSPSQVVSTLEKANLFRAHFTRPDGLTTQCNIFFPRKSVAWFPEHVFYKGSDMTTVPAEFVTVSVHRHERPGGVFTFKCDNSTCVKREEGDMVCAYVPNCPDLRDKMKWLPLNVPTGASLCTFVVKDINNVLQTETVAVTHGKTGHVYKKNFDGGSYITEYASVGSCMAPLVLEQKTPTIVGFHIGGNTSKQGVMQCITFSEAEKLIQLLEDKPGVILSSKAAPIPKTQYGRTILKSEEIHPHCMASRLTSDAYIDVLGSTEQRTMQKSTVTKSILSDHVADVMGVENQWGPPPLIPNWKGYNATLEHIVNPADMFVPSDLERARQDWLSDLKQCMTEYVKSEDFRPLTDQESVMGIPGKRFLDPLNMTTGMGFPIFGSKRNHFTETTVNGDIVRTPSDSIVEEVERMRSCWKKGERAYPVTTATLKDEPTLVGKDKVRVFQAAPVAFSLEIRKYFLPIARFLSMYPLQSESAVGINAFSQQWDEVIGHSRKFAHDGKVIAWDYSKYDVRMNSQMTRAVLTSFIDLACIGGYDEESLYIMSQMICDMVHPLIDYNGTLIMAYNMNTSGNNITVNINGAAGSIYVRLGFFHLYPDAPSFRLCVAAMTYGDDFVGSVKLEFRKFDFLTFQTFLAAHKMKITAPDKSDDAVSFMEESDADFLKRKSVFIPEIGCSIGSLDEMSIFKSLHSNLRSKTATSQEIAISCIEGAMHEWFAHGRETYNMRVKQMQEVCNRVHLPIPAVAATFDERVAAWKEKYCS
jgi:hypothetical protein